MHKNLDEQFKRQLSRYITAMENTIKGQLRKAKDKGFVAQNIIDEIANDCGITSEPGSTKELFTETFLLHYGKGDTISYIISVLKSLFGSTDPETETYETADDKRIALLISNERRLMNFFARYIAIQEMKTRLPDILNDELMPVQKQTAVVGHVVQWTASRDNKNEFVQLVYALYTAGYLNNGKGEITKIVESLAETLGVPLGKNWQSNLSASIHKSNYDYKPPIFDKIVSAYTAYANKLIMARENNG